MRIKQRWLLFFLVIFTAVSSIQAVEHVVKRGDCLSNIAKKYGVSMKAIREANNMDSETVYAGQTLKIPTSDKAATAENTAPEEKPKPAPVEKPKPKPTPEKAEAPKPAAAKKEAPKPAPAKQEAPTTTKQPSTTAEKQPSKPIQPLPTSTKNVSPYEPVGLETADVVYDSTKGTASPMQPVTPLVEPRQSKKPFPNFHFDFTGAGNSILFAIFVVIILGLLLTYLAITKWLAPRLEDMKLDIIRRIPANLVESKGQPQGYSRLDFERRFQMIEKLIMNHERNLYNLISSALVKQDDPLVSLPPMDSEIPVEGIPVRLISDTQVERYSVFHCYLELVPSENQFGCSLCSFVKTPIPALNQDLTKIFDLEDQGLNNYKVIFPAIFQKDPFSGQENETWTLVRKGKMVY